MANKKNDKPNPIKIEKNFDESLTDLFISELKEIYWSENHLVGAIPKMIDAAKSPALKKALSDHLVVTKTHAVRLETIFKQVKIPVLAKKCDATEGLTMSGEHVIENTLAGSIAREIGIIGSGIKVEQFEINFYKGLIDMATQLGFTNAVKIFHENLMEEKESAETLEALKNKKKK